MSNFRGLEAKNTLNPGPHEALPPSPWVQRWSHLAPVGGSVLDVACGTGRHMAWFAKQGHADTGLDHSATALAQAAAFGTTLLADLENAPWPLMQTAQSIQGGQASAPQTFDVVVVTHYLWRALLPTLARSVAPGGVLIYETFAQGNESVGKPSRSDFLLRPGELLQAFAELRVVAYEDGFLDAPARFVQRIVAVRPPVQEGTSAPAQGTLPRRYPL